MTGWARVVAALAVATVAALAGAAVMLDAAHPPAVGRYLERSRAVLDSDGRLLRAFATADGSWRFAASPDDVDPMYLAMLTAYEDKRFHRHPGVDPLALARAVWQCAASGKPV